MNRDDIMRMALEADLCPWVVKVPEAEAKKLERFAALVAAAEREACAKVCDSIDTYGDRAECWTEYAAELIRARGDK